MLTNLAILATTFFTFALPPQGSTSITLISPTTSSPVEPEIYGDASSST